jgi:hypothetical protein
MKTIKIILPVMLLIAACSKDNSEMNPGTAANDESDSYVTAAKGKTTRSFNANFSTSVDTNSAIPLTSCTGDIPGFANPGIFLHGNGLHIGKIKPSLSRIQDDSCNLSLTTKLLTTRFLGQIGTASGDLIYITGIDTIDAANYINAISFAGTITGTWTITGGTGKFTGATGSFRVNDFI